MPIEAANQPLLTPPNGLRAAHVPTAFPAAAAVTELPDDVNRSIGRTYCVGTAGDGPYAAAGIAACSQHFVHIIVKLIVISIVFSSFNNVDLLRSMSANCCMPRHRGWGTMATVGRGTTAAAMVGRCMYFA